MKVVVFTPYYHPKIGGLEAYARQLNIALQTLKGYEIVIITSNNTSRTSVKETVDGMTIYRLGIWTKLSNTPVNPLWSLAIRRILRHERPDVAMAHTPVPSMADAAALAVGKTPLVIVYHASTLLKGNDPVFNTIARIYQLYERLTLGKARRIFAVSPFVRSQFSPSLQAKTSIVPNAVWGNQIVERDQPSSRELLFVGSLDRTHSWKGLDQIIEALSLYRQQYPGEPCTLQIMGDGNARQQYEDQARTLGLQGSVTFLGAQTGDQKDATFRAATALVAYPTTANDAFPTVILEAWARSVPVVAAAIGPIPSLIDEGQNGYLTPACDPSALAKVLHNVLTSKQSTRSQVAQNARQLTKQNYTWEAQADSTDKILCKDVL